MCCVDNTVNVFPLFFGMYLFFFLFFVGFICLRGGGDGGGGFYDYGYKTECMLQ